MSNTTVIVSEFILQCAIEANQKTATICVLALIYSISMFANLLVIVVIILNPQLHAPMYIYISSLAVIDLANGSILIPKMLSVLLLGSPAVPYGAYVLQMFLVAHVEEMESLLLAFMAFDRYIAVIYPLHYTSVITNKKVGIGLLVSNILDTIFKLHILFFVGELSFCRTNILPFCFCDYSTMVRMSCNEDPKYLSSLSVAVTVSGVFPLLLILLSYSRIAMEAMKISSEESTKMSNTTVIVSELILQCAIEANQKTMEICVLTFIYFISMFGILLVILAIILNPQIHAPMYICIATLAVILLANSSILIPKMLFVLLLGSPVVRYAASVFQIFLVAHVEEMPFMAFDRYIAIIYP
ncbi:OR1E1 protein, partial [Polypterus senegalus]